MFGWKCAPASLLRAGAGWQRDRRQTSTVHVYLPLQWQPLINHRYLPPVAHAAFVLHTMRAFLHDGCRQFVSSGAAGGWRTCTHINTHNLLMNINHTSPHPACRWLSITSIFKIQDKCISTASRGASCLSPTVPLQHTFAPNPTVKRMLLFALFTVIPLTPKLHELEASDGTCETGVKGPLINLNMFPHKHRCTREAATDPSPVGTKGGPGLQMVQNADVISMFPKDCLAPIITTQSTSSTLGAVKFAG